VASCTQSCQVRGSAGDGAAQAINRRGARAAKEFRVIQFTVPLAFCARLPAVLPGIETGLLLRCQHLADLSAGRPADFLSVSSVFFAMGLENRVDLCALGLGQFEFAVVTAEKRLRFQRFQCE